MSVSPHTLNSIKLLQENPHVGHMIDKICRYVGRYVLYFEKYNLGKDTKKKLKIQD